MTFFLPLLWSGSARWAVESGHAFLRIQSRVHLGLDEMAPSQFIHLAQIPAGPLPHVSHQFTSNPLLVPCGTGFGRASGRTDDGPIP